MNSILQYWYFNLPNYVLAAAMYSALGRLLLSFLVQSGWKNYIWQAFVRISDPLLLVVRTITPHGVPETVLLIFTFLWLALLRLAFYFVMANFGLVPPVGAAT